MINSKRLGCFFWVLLIRTKFVGLHASFDSYIASNSILRINLTDFICFPTHVLPHLAFDKTISSTFLHGKKKGNKKTAL